MKKYAMLFFVSVFMSCATLIAQDQTTSQSNNGEKKEMRQGERRYETADIRAAKMAKDLSLSEVEKINVQTLLEKQDTIFAKFRSEVSRESPEFRTKFRELRNSQDAELETIIGKEKFQQYQTLRAEERQKRMNK